jgi:hypothetical protein
VSDLFPTTRHLSMHIPLHDVMHKHSWLLRAIGGRLLSSRLCYRSTYSVLQTTYLLAQVCYSCAIISGNIFIPLTFQYPHIYLRTEPQWPLPTSPWTSWSAILLQGSRPETYIESHSRPPSPHPSILACLSLLECC